MNKFKKMAVINIFDGFEVKVNRGCAHIHKLYLHIPKEKFQLIADVLELGDNADAIYFEEVLIAYPQEEEK